MRPFEFPLPLLLVSALLGAAAPAAAEAEDPWRGLNEGVHGFNEGVDQWVLEPIATGWDAVLPEPVQEAVGNFFENLVVPRTVLNDFLQGHPRDGLRHAGRFIVNTTLGVGGLFDVAGTKGDLTHDPEDFGQTLGHWGVGPGPYLVLPLLGPSTVRDTVALPLDYAANPSFWVDEGVVTGGLTAVNLTNTRADLLEEVAENRATQLNYYVFVRDAYLQNREKNVHEGDVPEDEDEYDTDF